MSDAEKAAPPGIADLEALNARSYVHWRSPELEEAMQTLTNWMQSLQATIENKHAVQERIAEALENQNEHLLAMRKP